MSPELYTWQAWLNWSAWMLVAGFMGFVVGRARGAVMAAKALAVLDAELAGPQKRYMKGRRKTSARSRTV